MGDELVEIGRRGTAGTDHTADLDGGEVGAGLDGRLVVAVRSGDAECTDHEEDGGEAEGDEELARA